MTDKTESERLLFEGNSSDEERRNRRKRNSFGLKLPIRVPAAMAGNGKKAETVADPTSGGGTGPSGSGTVLGFAGVSRVSTLVFKRTSSSGAEVEFNIWADVNKGVTAEHLEKIMQVLVSVPNETNIASFIEGILYQGFDREFYIRHALGLVSVSVFCRFALIGAIRGSNFEKIRDSCIEMPSDLTRLVSDGSIIKKAKKRTDLTILRFTASIPHWVAYWMHLHDVPKKIEGSDCPGFLQFPAAASVPMSKDLRLKHISFCQEFSALLPGGTFNVNIYLVAYSNMVPIDQLPADFLAKLGVNSLSEARSVTTDEINKIAKTQLVKA